jgi:hypothetical protein
VPAPATVSEVDPQGPNTAAATNPYQACLRQAEDDSDFEASVDRCKKTYPEYANRIKRETPPLQ